MTICDACHCSLIGPTDPNRYYVWTGYVGNDGKGGGPVITNAEARYDWTTYPARTATAGTTSRSPHPTAYLRRLAGHLETGRPSTSDPALG